MTSLESKPSATEHAIAGSPATPSHWRDVPRDIIELKPDNMVGLAALRSLFECATVVPEDTYGHLREDMAPSLDALVDELAATGHGLIMCMGKGGVGKTTIAAAIATRLAQKGHDVHLTTTDPAGHLENTVGDGYDLPSLSMSRVNPQQAVKAYREHARSRVRCRRCRGCRIRGR